MCALGWGGRTKKRMNALLHKITSTCVFIRNCIQGSEKHGYYWYFRMQNWMKNSGTQYSPLWQWTHNLRMINEECWTDKSLFKKFTYKLTKYQHKSGKFMKTIIIWSSLVRNTRYVMFPRHETALIIIQEELWLTWVLISPHVIQLTVITLKAMPHAQWGYFSNDMMYWLSHSGYMFETK